jgi:hypothetical protein
MDRFVLLWSWFYVFFMHYVILPNKKNCTLKNLKFFFVLASKIPSYATVYIYSSLVFQFISLNSQNLTLHITSLFIPFILLTQIKANIVYPTYFLNNYTEKNERREKRENKNLGELEYIIISLFITYNF